MTRERAPGTALLHPLAVLSLLVLVANDHWLKHTHPGLLSGKLSGFAAVLLLPLFLHALFELSQRALLKRPASAQSANRALAVCLALTCLVYAPPELWPPAETAYRYGFGALQWPFRMLWTVAHGEARAAFAPVRATADASDLLALTMLWVAWRIARRGPQTPPHPVIATTIALLVLCSPRVASAAGRSQAHVHDGLYLSFELGAEGTFVRSAASVSNGFQQPIPSSARGLGLPSGAFELGGTLRGTGLVLGGSLGFTEMRDPIVSTQGTRFELENATYSSFRFGAFTRYYPDTRDGLSLGLGAGLMSLGMQSSGAEQLRGFYLALEAGHGLWIGKQWTLGLNARLTAASLRGEVPGATSVFMPGLFLAAAWH